MTKFILNQTSPGRSGLVNFEITDEKGTVRGSVSVPSTEAGSLIASWKGAHKLPARKADAEVMAKALLAKRSTRTSAEARKSVLRGG